MKFLGRVFLFLVLLQGGACLSVTPLCMERLESVRDCANRIDDALVQFEKRFPSEKIVLQCEACNQVGDFNNIVFMITLQAIQGAISDNDQFHCFKKVLEDTQQVFSQGTLEQVKTFMLSTTQASRFGCLHCKSSAWQVGVRECSSSGRYLLCSIVENSLEALHQTR